MSAQVRFSQPPETTKNTSLPSKRIAIVHYLSTLMAHQAMKRNLLHVWACSAGGCSVVPLACVGGLTLLACACAFHGFLLSFLLVSTALPLRLFVTG